MKSARQTAFEALLKIHRDNAYSNIVLDNALLQTPLSQKDAALSVALVYGVIERMITLDYNLQIYLTKPIKKLRPEVLVALRLGAYQLLFTDKIPPSAAINESVKIVKANKCSFASGLVNAVLRKVSINGLKLPDKANNFVNYLSVLYSCPEWLVELWCKSYGEKNAIEIMSSSFGNVPTFLRVNTLKTNTSELIEMLKSEGVEASECQEVENAVKVSKIGNIEQLDSFRKGYFHVQDISSQLCCKSLGVKNNETVLDMCSAPGGKAFTLAQIMNNTGKVFAFDVYSSRVNLIKEGVKRLGLTNIIPLVSDATAYNSDIEISDKVLCDVPCSGLGIIRKKPEIRYKSLLDIDKLPNLQYLILCTSTRYLKKGGLLIYSTCTLNPKENEDVCNRFLADNPSFKSVKVLENVSKLNTESDYVTLSPHINNSDGFFIAAFSETE
ncbi:MAG TPA: 16S rRNA (cytosine(967)-C(5))-methyltransferase RsmB [Clostridia bacterium]|nr:16S rRNA (cytosine(967)-C(5))-methyltransferase RsmB [Clostridia bacterium]